jgi:hypothetical protein
LAKAWIDGHIHASALVGAIPQSIVYDNDHCLVAKIMPARRPHVVNEDIDVGRLREDGLGARRRREIGGDAEDVAIRKGSSHLPHHFIDADASTAVDADRCAGMRQSFRCGAADTRNARATSASIRRLRLWVNTVGCHTPAPIGRPTNQRNSRL